MRYNDNITIIRAPRSSEQPYFLSRRATAQDRRLSYEARGMLWYVLSRPDDWELQVEDLMQGCGRDKVYSLLAELRTAGYVELVSLRVRGRFAGSEYRVHEQPVDSAPETPPPSPRPEKPDTVTPDTAAPYPAKPTHTNKRINRSEIEQNTESDRTDSSLGGSLPPVSSEPEPVPATVETAEEKPEDPAPEADAPAVIDDPIPAGEDETPSVVTPLPETAPVAAVVPSPPVPPPPSPSDEEDSPERDPIFDIVVQRGFGLKLDDEAGIIGARPKINWVVSWLRGNAVKSAPGDKHKSLPGCTPPITPDELNAFYDDWSKRGDRYGRQVHPPTVAPSMAFNITAWRNRQVKPVEVKEYVPADGYYLPTPDQRLDAKHNASSQCSQCDGKGWVYDPNLEQRPQWDYCQCTQVSLVQVS